MRKRDYRKPEIHLTSDLDRVRENQEWLKLKQQEFNPASNISIHSWFSAMESLGHARLQLSSSISKVPPSTIKRSNKLRKELDEALLLLTPHRPSKYGDPKIY